MPTGFRSPAVFIDKAGHSPPPSRLQIGRAFIADALGPAGANG